MTLDPHHDAAPHDLLAAYLLDAVDDDERLLFEEHLLGCADCERELAELGDTVTALASSVPVAPPPRLREDLLRQVAQDRASAGQGTPPPDQLAAQRERRSSRRLVLLAGAAAAVAAIMALVFGPFLGSDAMTTQTIAAAADAERFEVTVGDATATIIVSRTLNKAAIETSDMAPAPDGQAYQLWLAQADGTLTDAGLMPQTDDPAMVLSSDLGEAVAVGITMEPSGGSPQPTSEPIALVSIQA